MNSHLRASLLGVMAVILGHDAHAGFYRWTDAQGQVRISNIPPRGVARDGSVLPAYNPQSIAAQQAALRRRLEARDAALAREQAASSQHAPPAELDAAPTPEPQAQETSP